MSAAIAMPRWTYNPGTDGGPDRDRLEVAKALVPLRFEGFVPAHDRTFQYGLALHDAGFFWEAHEIWEAVWKAAPMNGRDRLALRALIQIANAGLKLRQPRPRAASRLIEEARALLSELAARVPASEPESVAGTLEIGGLRDGLADGVITVPLRLAWFFSWDRKMNENA